MTTEKLEKFFFGVGVLTCWFFIMALPSLVENLIKGF
jgi:hypothetical protein